MKKNKYLKIKIKYLKLKKEISKKIFFFLNYSKKKKSLYLLEFVNKILITLKIINCKLYALTTKFLIFKRI